MRISRLGSIPRLSRRALGRLLDKRACVSQAIGRVMDHGDKSTIKLDEIIWRRDRVTVKGSTRNTHVTIGLAGMASYPALAAAPGTCQYPLAAFEVVVPRTDRRARLEVRCEGDTSEPSVVAEFFPPAPSVEACVRIAALPRTIVFALSYWREVVGFLKTGDPALSVVLRDTFGLDGVTTPAPVVPATLFSSEGRQERAAKARVTIIVPIHNAASRLRRLLERLTRGIDVDHRILLVDDASTDPDIPPILNEFLERTPTSTRVTFETNRGFVAAVNHGLSVARETGSHAIILNSDTLPPTRPWVGRLLAPILNDDTVASVTPLSNTAEIASVPAPGIVSDMTGAMVDALDLAADRFGATARAVNIPTGIGFAMAMNARYLEKLGGFDPVFGRGYGEEVDWCQRARAAGGRHVLATSVFVGHDGGASFGPEKRARIDAAARIISARYPAYDRDVRDWSVAAPHAPQRAALSLAWLGAVVTKPVPIFVGHVLGGGAELALQREIKTTLASGAPGVVVLRLGGEVETRLEIVGQAFRHDLRVPETGLLHALLEPLRRRSVIYSCAVGARNPAEVPRLLLDLASGRDASLELRVHDYFMISPSYCLLNAGGCFSGVPDSRTEDPAHRSNEINGGIGPSLAQWQARWADVIRRADSITAYSRSSADILATAYPVAAGKTAVIPHDMSGLPPTPMKPGGQSIGVLGGINAAKGAEVLIRLARHFRRTDSNRRLVIVGELDPDFSLPAPHRITGRYTPADISRIAAQNDVGLWLIPSVWPETFSFTTREALATGLPVLTFGLGAQGEAARAAPNGKVLRIQPDEIASLAREIERAFSEAARPQVVRRSRSAA